MASLTADSVAGGSIIMTAANVGDYAGNLMLDKALFGGL